jgi:hypothetical protein
MARLIFSGVMTKLPKLKIMAHHLGAMIPFFDERIETGWATLGSRTSGEDYSHVLPSLGKPLLDCFKDFYGDTALCGGRIGLICGIDFYGADHVLYASDAPRTTSARRSPPSPRSTFRSPTRRRFATVTQSRFSDCLVELRCRPARADFSGRIALVIMAGDEPWRTS